MRTSRRTLIWPWLWSVQEGHKKNDRCLWRSKCLINKVNSGPPYTTRTCDLRLRRPLLYPAELRAVKKIYVGAPPVLKEKSASKFKARHHLTRTGEQKLAIIPDHLCANACQLPRFASTQLTRQKLHDPPGRRRRIDCILIIHDRYADLISADLLDIDAVLFCCFFFFTME